MDFFSFLYTHHSDIIRVFDHLYADMSFIQSLSFLYRTFENKFSLASGCLGMAAFTTILDLGFPSDHH